ncbi:hypothetical protein H6P81_017702 [Aristolochia fimbriata]|uniref:Pentatricopeptide repeat-containing protein n=1 Tax=Aristolochia fimbriata TaxID=158543 RepID=A0AAV7DZC1_ARIFI|nr:hypothetical protein H6P81_017702 [Aristolochia fimbriata]
MLINMKSTFRWDCTTVKSVMHSILFRKLDARPLVFVRYRAAFSIAVSRTDSPETEDDQRWLKHGKEIHGKVVTCGIGGDVVVNSSLVDMYGKCRSVKDSRHVFDRMPIKNSVSWSAMLGADCENGHYNAVLELFNDMEKQDDHYSIGTVLRACAGLTDVRHGREVHCQFLRRIGWRDIIMESALVDLYSKCGYVEYAQSVFSNIVVRNLITWNSMICGFAQNGKVNETLELFNEMVRTGIRPDYISFIGVLSACSYSGLVEEGKDYFRKMTEDYGILPGVEHYNCMVDLLGRAGLVEEAESLIEKSVVRNDSSLLLALLGACASHPNVSVAERVAKRLMQLEPDSHLSYILIGNVYKAVGMWEEALKVRKVMEDKGIRKTPGKSYIEVKKKVMEKCRLRKWIQLVTLTYLLWVMDRCPYEKSRILAILLDAFASVNAIHAELLGLVIWS